MNEIINRIKAPTPKFFKTLRTIGISMAAIAATILTAPVALPAIVIQIAGYVAVAGGVIGVISQTAKEDPK